MNSRKRNIVASLTAQVTMVFALILGASLSAQAQVESVLYSFKGGYDGEHPSSRLVRDARGNLYGTTPTGGAHNNGKVFQISPLGAETVLYSFQGGKDGSYPSGGMVRDGRGNLYGTTLYGGTLRPYGGLGTVFKLSANGTERVIHTFQGGKDGSYPNGDLIRDANGHLFGTTQFGGAFGSGTVFEINPKGKEVVLHDFADGADGGYPSAGVVMDANGNLYGTTPFTNNVGMGTVFEIMADHTPKTLYSFQGSADGYYPQGGVVLDGAGNVYGTTYYGGGFFGLGVVFQVSQDGNETVLHRFRGGMNRDGASPVSGLVLDAQGHFYGTTPFGGMGHGTVFQMATDGTEHVIYNFKGGAQGDGGRPSAALILDNQGNLYGTTTYGGVHDHGTVFVLTP